MEPFGSIASTKDHRTREDSDMIALLPYIFYVTVLVCIAPSLLNLFGIDFDSPSISLNQIQSQKEIFEFFSGTLVHSLLEWSAVILALLTVFLSFNHYRIAKNPMAFIIGSILLYSGSMDALHAFTAIHPAGSAPPNNDLITFSWFLSRLFNSLLCLICILIILIPKRYLKEKYKTIFTTGIPLLLIILSYEIIHTVDSSEALLKMQFSHSAITRPWDIYPAIILILTIPVYLIVLYRKPDTLIQSLLISAVPAIAAQLHMAFGSENLFDNHFNIAHFLKIIYYLVLFIGISYDYITISRFAVSLHTKTKSLIDTTPSAVITIDDQGLIEDINSYTTKMFGYDREELLGKNISILIAPPEQKKHDGYIANYLRTGKAKIIGTSGRAVLGLHKNGLPLPVSLNIGEFTLQDKRFFTGVMSDISEKHRFEQELIRANTKIKALINNSPCSIITTNDRGTIKEANPHTTKMFGYTEEELIGKNAAELAAPNDRERHNEAIANYRLTGKAKIIGTTGRIVSAMKKSGEMFPASLNLGEFIVDEKKFFTGIMIDISEKEKFERELIRSNEELSQFAYRTSHDLKAPLITIKGLAQIICEDLNDKDYHEAKNNALKIEKHVSKLERLIVNILNLTKSDAQDNDIVDINLYDVIQSIQKDIEKSINDNNVSIKTHIGPSLRLKASKMRITQVLENMISNSVKYHNPKASPPYIKISAMNKNHDAKIIVEDNGLGIPEDQQNKVFTMFQRFHPDVSEGSGLGMHIIKKHLDKMDAKITFTSAPNKGTIFTILIPNK